MPFNKFLSQFVLVIMLVMLNTAVQAAKLKPFVLASKTASGDFTQIAADTKTKLTSAGFEVVGEYSPYKNAKVIIVTNDELKKNASKTKFGGYGAVQRIAITDHNGEIQVSFTNPTYMSNAYRMKGDLNNVSRDLKKALGDNGEYGSKKGLSAKDLRDYHYMWGMPYFDEPDELADHDSYDKAIKKVEAGLAAKKSGVSKVFRVDLSNKRQSIFGVAMTKGMSSDKTIMKEVDFKKTRSTAHLPYELLVDKNGKVYALSAKFRIAINFPDLSMAGKNSFMGIMSSPDAIKEVLTKVSGGELDDW